MLLKLVFVSAISYLLGNFATSYIVTRAFAKIDIREYGSGNAGSTNVLRVLGAKPAAIAFIGDVLKGVAAVLIGRYIAGSYGEILAGIFVVIGHDWPIVLNYKGGKGVATTIGVMIPINPLMVVGIVMAGVIVIVATRYVSLASVCGMLVFPATMIALRKPAEYIIFSLVLSAMAIYKHRSNIKRLISGTESKIGHKVKNG
ncbi:MAG: glycerol-3-phosphate 1-O-acyltransferase PlsY [Caulobacteraceae bacterium]